jgi:hypothetical protein
MARNTFILLLLLMVVSYTLRAKDVLIEAEQMNCKGGWVTDQQFMDLMGSPYLMAHGLGKPVKDASTIFRIDESGTYNVFVRTYNWTSPWTTSAGPGRYCIKIDNGFTSSAIGDTSSKWEWIKIGHVKLKQGSHKLSLHDLTGFDGRCDAIYLTTDNTDPLTVDNGSCGSWRRSFMKDNTNKDQHFDFVVIGGGIAGMCAAMAAAREGCKVALVNDRPVLGGNNSSEVRVHLGGIIETGVYKRLGRMIREFGHSRGGNAMSADFYEDERKDSFIASEPNIMLFAGWRAVGVEKIDNRITGITIYEVNSGREMELRAPIFSDCTGDGSIGALAGADYRMGREGRSEFKENYAPIQPDSMVMGASVQWYSEETKKRCSFPEFSYGVQFNNTNAERIVRGEWTWETGMNLNQITDAERIRDYGMLVVYSNWSWLKNHDKEKADFADYKLAWVAYVLGKRESRRLMGDYILAQEDIDKDVWHEDASFTTTWAIDLHFPDSVNEARFPGNAFKSKTVHRWIHPYAVPYRCLYSRNIDNLFMAGRDISCTHVALGTVRVMRTTGMMGEVVGMAASLCKRFSVNPRDVYRYHLNELKTLMEKGEGKEAVPDNQHFNEPNKTLPYPRAYINRTQNK